MKNKTLSIATLLLTGALLFAGCGQTGNTTGNTPSTTAGQETATTEQTDSTAQTAKRSAPVSKSVAIDNVLFFIIRKSPLFFVVQTIV